MNTIDDSVQGEKPDKGILKPDGYTIDTNIDTGEQTINYPQIEQGDRVKELEAENAELRENYEGMSAHCNHLTRINIFNMAFDEANSEWKKQHKVKEGETFIDWYMRYHANHMTELEQLNSNLKGKIAELEAKSSPLIEFLKANKDKHEFRLVVNQDGRGYIHALGQDSETLDFTI